MVPDRNSPVLRATTHTAAALDQSVTIQHRMDGALGRNGNAGEPANQTFADFSSTPAGVLALHIQDVVLDLEGS